MNRESEPSSLNLRPRAAERWLKIAFYICLLLVVAWLYFASSGDATFSRQVPADKPQASASVESGERGQSTDEPRSRPRGPRRNPDASEGKKSKLPPADIAKQDESRDSSLIVRDIRVTNEDGDVVYRGDVDLRPTLERIERGVRLRFSHDGIVFENRERRLPNKQKGYYHEFVQPTVGDNGPGGQRIVQGRAGEIYYSPDHYHTFRRIK